MSRRRSFGAEVAAAERHTARMRAAGKFPAVPPNDYKGTQADWMRGLMERGLWNGEKPEFHGDVWITADQHAELLDACEADRPRRTHPQGRKARR